MKVTALGHAGLKIETQHCHILIDPWFSPEGAFLASWFQYPDNQHLVVPCLFEPHAIIISHEHFDHLDPWFLAQVPEQVPVIIPKYASPVLYQKVATAGSRQILEISPWEIFYIEDVALFFVSEESPMNHDSAIVVLHQDQTLLNLNDSRLSPAQLRSIRTKVGGTIDLLLLQGAGASWYPLCYDYAPDRRQDLSQRKRQAKFNYMARVVRVVQPRMTVPFAGPPCFLDPALANFNDEMKEGIFPDPQQVRDWLLTQGIAETALLLPGDSWDLDTHTKQSSSVWDDFSFGDRQSYLDKYAKQRAVHIERVMTRYPVPERSLWTPFQEYFHHLLSLSPYFNQKINMRVGFEVVGAGGGNWAVDFRPASQGVYDQPGTCHYRYRFASRWLPALLNGSLLWEDFFLSLRFQASRDPDIYNDHLLGLLKFAHAEALQAVESYEQSMTAGEHITVHADSKTYSVQRYCPHAGVDLMDAGEILPGGILRCLGHHYEFNLETGECLNGNCRKLDSQQIN
jgi:UDP-MurNAc hydroxylase